MTSTNDLSYKMETKASDQQLAHRELLYQIFRQLGLHCQMSNC